MVPARSPSVRFHPAGIAEDAEEHYDDFQDDTGMDMGDFVMAAHRHCPAHQQQHPQDMNKLYSHSQYNHQRMNVMSPTRRVAPSSPASTTTMTMMMMNNHPKQEAKSRERLQQHGFSWKQTKMVSMMSNRSLMTATTTATAEESYWSESESEDDHDENEDDSSCSDSDDDDDDDEEIERLLRDESHPFNDAWGDMEFDDWGGDDQESGDFSLSTDDDVYRKQTQAFFERQEQINKSRRTGSISPMMAST